MTRRAAPESDAIAIVGMGCRFPRAHGVEAFWQLLIDGQTGIADVPADRWDIDAFFHTDASVPAAIASRKGGFLPDLDRFDAAFFGISPREAPHVDPRQRLVLEITWEALEGAGIVPATLGGSRTGVWMAVLTNDYDHLMFSDLRRADAFSGAGTANSVVANRLSYVFDWRGPSMALDTACSGSLVAIHLACESLRRGESTLAIAGGVGVNLWAKSDVFFTKMGALSPDGQCRSFDSRANGIARSDGAGVVVLKRVDAARRDGNPILAIVAGSAVNHVGRGPGIMAPTADAQAAVLRDAYAAAGISPADVQLIEAHGTGTRLGDPIEVQGLSMVLPHGRTADQRCLLGSVKSNIGHTEPAAGVAGVIKCVLAMRHRAVPPSLHFEAPNPLIPFDRLPFDVPRAVTAWPAPARPLVAGVSGFGFAGANAHVVLQEAPADCAQDDAGHGPSADAESGHAPYVLPLSARTPEALQELGRSWERFLAASEAPPADICRTAATRRTHHVDRMALVGRTRDDLRAALEQRLADPLQGRRAGGRGEPRLAFVFSGQGSHRPRMGMELYEREPVFRGVIDRCAALLQPHVAWGLVDELSREGGQARFGDTEITQPAIFAVQVALAELWRSWGVTPQIVVGHSLGEVAAAVVSGALSLADGLDVVRHRSRVMKRAAGAGRTATVGLSLDAARDAVCPYGDDLAVAGTNSPTLSVVAGTPEAVAQLQRGLEAAGVFCRVLHEIDIAFHSPQMDPLVPDLVAALSPLAPRGGGTPMISTVTGDVIDGALLTAQYWGRNLREPFLFTPAVERLVARECTTIVEIGPHAVLGSAMLQTLRQRSGDHVWVIPSLLRQTPEHDALRKSLAAVYEAGHDIEWSAIYGACGAVAALPPYPWQRQRYWYDQLSGQAVDDAPRKRAGGHPLLGERVEAAVPIESPDGEQRLSLWEMDVEASRPRYFGDHRFLGQVIVPGAVILEMARAAGTDLFHDRAVVVSDLVFERAFALSATDRHRVQVSLNAAADRARFAVHGRVAGAPAQTRWTRHASGEVRPASDRAQQIDLDPIRARCLIDLPVDAHYAARKADGLEYGPMCRALSRLWGGIGEALGEIALPHGVPAQGYALHPVIVDAAFQVVAAAMAAGDGPIQQPPSYLPHAVRQWQVFRPGATRLWCHARLLGKPGDTVLEADLDLIDDDGHLCARAEGFALKRVARSGAGALVKAAIEPRWHPQEPGNSGAPERRHWLIVRDQTGIAAALSDLLLASGSDVTLAGPHEDFEVMLDQLAPPADAVLMLTALDAAGPDAVRSCVVQPALALTQALIARGTATPIYFVTRGAQPVGRHAMAPWQAPLSGLALTIDQEHPELAATCVDLDPDPDASVAADLLSELAAADGERRVAWRQGRRYVGRIAAASLVASPDEISIRGDATYLISGGLGALGLHTAALLADLGARSLLLVGRTIPDGPPDAIKALRSRGIDVRLGRADVANPRDVRRLFADLLPRMPPLAGVVHAAGVLDDGTLRQLDIGRFDRVFEPKLRGAWNLHVATEGLALDFFLLYSSVASLIGSAGQANYAAANAFLDALAHHRRRLGLPALSINWGAWAGDGMAARGTVRARLASRGVSTIGSGEGLAWLAQVLRAQEVTQVGLLPVDWRLFLAQFGGRVPSIFRSIAERLPPTTAPRAATAASIRALPHAERYAVLRDYVRGEAAAVFGFDSPADLGARERFFDLGMDSLMAVDLRGRLQSALDLPLPATIAFDYPTLDTLANHLVEAIGGEAPAVAAAAGAASDLDTLTDEQLARLLAAELSDGKPDGD